MTESQALVLLGALQAAFPRGSDRPETIDLYATQLTRYDVGQAQRAAQRIIDTRTDPWLPTWAEIREALADEAPPVRQLPAPSGVLPDEATQAELRRLQAELEDSIKDRSEAMHSAPPIGVPRSQPGRVWIESREGNVLWELTPTGDGRDDTEIRHAADTYRHRVATLRKLLRTAKQGAEAA